MAFLERPSGLAPAAEAAGLAAREWGPRARRTTTTLMIARLLRGDGSDGLCRVRNVSVGGMRIEAPTPLALDEAIGVELRTGQRVKGVVVWTSAGTAGMRFATPVDLEELLSSPLDRPSGPGALMPRAPRFDAESHIRLSFCGRIRPAVIENVSQSGARLRMADPEMVQGEIMAAVPGLEPKRAAIRWTSEDEVGLTFLDKLKFQEFARWLGEPAHRFSAREG